MRLSVGAERCVCYRAQGVVCVGGSRALRASGRKNNVVWGAQRDVYGEGGDAGRCVCRET